MKTREVSKDVPCLEDVSCLVTDMINHVKDSGECTVKTEELLSKKDHCESITNCIQATHLLSGDHVDGFNVTFQFKSEVLNRPSIITKFVDEKKNSKFIRPQLRIRYNTWCEKSLGGSDEVVTDTSYSDQRKKDKGRKVMLEKEKEKRNEVMKARTENSISLSFTVENVDNVKKEEVKTPSVIKEEDGLIGHGQWIEMTNDEYALKAGYIPRTYQLKSFKHAISKSLLDEGFLKFAENAILSGDMLINLLRSKMRKMVMEAEGLEDYEKLFVSNGQNLRYTEEDFKKVKDFVDPEKHCTNFLMAIMESEVRKMGSQTKTIALKSFPKMIALLILEQTDTTLTKNQKAAAAFSNLLAKFVLGKSGSLYADSEDEEEFKEGEDDDEDQFQVEASEHLDGEDSHNVLVSY